VAEHTEQKHMVRNKRIVAFANPHSFAQAVAAMAPCVPKGRIARRVAAYQFSALQGPTAIQWGCTTFRSAHSAILERFATSRD